MSGKYRTGLPGPATDYSLCLHHHIRPRPRPRPRSRPVRLAGIANLDYRLSPCAPYLCRLLNGQVPHTPFLLNSFRRTLIASAVRWKAVWVSLHHGSVMQSKTLSQMSGTSIFCGLAWMIPRERLYLMSCTMSYLKGIFVLTAILLLLPVSIMSCRLLNLRRVLNAGLLRRCLALLLIMHYCLNDLIIRRFHFHRGFRRIPVRQRTV